MREDRQSQASEGQNLFTHTKRTLPAKKKKHPTPDPKPRTADPSMTPMPSPDDCHPSLREHIREATQEIMRDQLITGVGADWGGCTPERTGSRHGLSTRDVATTSGPIEEVNGLRDRAGEWHTQRVDRSEQQVADGLTRPGVSRTRTQKVGEVAHTLRGVAPSARAVRRLPQSLTEPGEAWRVRPLLTRSRLLSLDGIHGRVRQGATADSTIDRTCALGAWRRSDRIVTDGHDGLLAAMTALFPATPRQRCVVQKPRTVLNAIPQSRTTRGRDRSGRDVDTEEARGCLAPAQRFPGDVPAALSRSHPECA
jgi:putative transposase